MLILLESGFIEDKLIYLKVIHSTNAATVETFVKIKFKKPEKGKKF